MSLVDAACCFALGRATEREAASGARARMALAFIVQARDNLLANSPTAGLPFESVPAQVLHHAPHFARDQALGLPRCQSSIVVKMPFWPPSDQRSSRAARPVEPNNRCEAADSAVTVHTQKTALSFFASSASAAERFSSTAIHGACSVPGIPCAER